MTRLAITQDTWNTVYMSLKFPKAKLDIWELSSFHGCYDGMMYSVLFMSAYSVLVHWQVATFILQKILLDETGLSYICQTYDRFSHVAMILVSVRILYSVWYALGRWLFHTGHVMWTFISNVHHVLKAIVYSCVKEVWFLGCKLSVTLGYCWTDLTTLL